MSAVLSSFCVVSVSFAYADNHTTYGDKQEETAKEKFYVSC